MTVNFCFARPFIKTFRNQRNTGSPKRSGGKSFPRVYATVSITTALIPAGWEKN